MRIEFRYNHMLAEEYLMCRKPNLKQEIEDCIASIDAERYLKVSCDKANLGAILYDQKALNEEIKQILYAAGWKDFRTSYYVTSDERVTKELVKIADKEAQKELIEENALEALPSFNQVDYLKDRVAIEVQFGKYFSVAYDLHVKHTFFYIQDQIDVGIEIIPTHRMMDCMDTGVAWFENEVTNVIREGRNNPTVPIYILGIEGDDQISSDPMSYSRSRLKEILENSSKTKFINQMQAQKTVIERKWNEKKSKAYDRFLQLSNEVDTLHMEYNMTTDIKAKKAIAKNIISVSKKRDKANDSYVRICEDKPLILQRIEYYESVIDD